jgi:hypothetical protein
MMFGAGVVFYWVVSTVLAWLVQGVEEDINER